MRHKKRPVSLGEKKIRAKLVPQKKNSCRQIGLQKNSCTEKFLHPLRLFLMVRPLEY